MSDSLTGDRGNLSTLEFIDDELVEVTPKSIRLRKKALDPNMRKRAAKG